MNERIKAIRNHYQMNMRDFAAKLGISHSAICLYESGERQINERLIISICSIFPEINEEWLRSGEGEMLRPRTRNDEISDIFAKLYEAEPGDFQAELTQAIYRMTPEQIKALKAFVLDLAEHLNNEN